MAFGFRRKSNTYICLIVLTLLYLGTVSARGKAADQLTVPEIEDELQVTIILLSCHLCVLHMLIDTLM
jgi:hypothetical protein